MKSDWFRYNWGDKFKLTKDTPSDYSNDKGGRRIITSPGCLIGTGFGGDFVISDDPENAEQIYSDVARVKAHRWWDDTISSRLDEPNIGILINLQQRLHQDDLTGYLRKNQASLYKFIVLPAEESDDVEPMELRARYVDGLLFPQRLSAEVLADKKIQQRNTYPGQYQQSPVAVGGNLFKEAWVRFFTRDQVPPFDRILVSADTANTDLTSSCPVSIQVWAEKIPDYYLLYDETVQMSPKTTETRIGAIANMYPGSQIVVEWAASGFGCIEGLKKTHSGVFAFDPRKYGGKEKRADSIRYLWESGNVFIPDNEYMRTQYLPEIYVFPNGKYMDRVDSMAQALIFFTRRNGSDGVRGVYDRGNIY
jgi:phage terminase large subunit-like protein